MISAQTIRRIRPVEPFHERTVANGMTYGLSSHGYDVRVDQLVTLRPGEFALASTLERFDMPNDLAGIVHDKSSWARQGVAVQNTVIEAGWRGYLTLELTNHGKQTITIPACAPIAQIVFHRLDEPTEQPYNGRYQDQARGPQPARKEPAPQRSRRG